ncbi:unnamed protein product [Orchesella dallaii]|uniref:PRA1 family protein n=1 Tax=Orchesella dallaii TaxID=48710 RepID=A0ABP1Q8D1_9HEXA
MKLEGEIASTPTVPTVFQGFKLPNDGNIAGLLKVQMSKEMLREWYVKRKETIRPWATFFSTSKFKQPISSKRLPRRVVKNVEYFQSNYLFVFIGLFIYCLVTSPLLLFAVIASLGICYWIVVRNTDKKLTIFGRQLTLAQQYSLVGLCSMPVLWICGAGAALFWVLGASCFLIMTHAVLYDIESLVGPEEDSFELTMEEVV